MNQSERDYYEKYAASCLNGSKAGCACACPFNLEVGLFVDKMRIHSYSGAYRLYQENVVFPEIVSRLCPAPCRAHCVFGEDAIRLPLLEKTCVANVREKKPSFYNMPPKGSRIAVVGAGLSGLACALKLCMKNYPVTVFEKSGRIGGNLWGLLDSDIFLTEFETQFEDFSYDLSLNTEITDLDALKDFDAVYIATGCGGNDFGLAEGMNRQSHGSARPGIFLGGRLLGGGDMDAIEHGKIASFSIEKYLQIGKMDGVETTYHVDACKFSAPKAARKGRREPCSALGRGNLQPGGGLGGGKALPEVRLQRLLRPVRAHAEHPAVPRQDGEGRGRIHVPHRRPRRQAHFHPRHRDLPAVRRLPGFLTDGHRHGEILRRVPKQAGGGGDLAPALS
jgi:hypothetical protein